MDVGSSKQEFGYDLNAAAFEWESSSDSSYVKFPKKLFGALFHFSTAASKNITITLAVLSGTTRYTIYENRIKLPNHTNYIWKPDIELPQNVDITIHVSKTATACSMNMITIDR